MARHHRGFTATLRHAEHQGTMNEHRPGNRLDFDQQLNLITVNTQADSATGYDNNTVLFIDRFTLPASAREMFYKRVRINRAFIRSIPGFIDDAAYESPDGNGSIHFITVARWESKEALAKAKALVQEEYQKEGFDPAVFMKSLNIVMDRAMYTPVD